MTSSRKHWKRFREDKGILSDLAFLAWLQDADLMELLAKPYKQPLWKKVAYDRAISRRQQSR